MCDGVCPECDNRLDTPPESQVESEEKRRGVAEELSIAGPLRGKSYCDFDRGHRDLCAEPGVRGDKKTVFTHKLTTFEQLKQIYTIF